MSPQVIFGTASFGMDQTAFQDSSSISSLLQTLNSLGVKRLDSAARYPPLNPGRAEQLIGESKDASSGFLVDTKVFTDTRTDGSGDLNAEAIDKSITSSLARLERQSDGVHVLHIHRADPSTPLLEQVRAFNDQIKKGHCKAWGASNVPIPMLREIFQICETEGLAKPVCYQGEYNIITRGAETELLPLLRQHGVAFNAFRALASGFMTGKFVRGDHAGTRFSDDNPLGKASQKLFGAEVLHSAMKTFDEATSANNLTTLEVAVRWIFHHSALQDSDGIVLGASQQSQATDILLMLQKGPLSQKVLEAAENLWSSVEESRAGII